MKDTSILADSEFRDKLDQWIAASIEYCVNHYEPIRVSAEVWVVTSGNWGWIDSIWTDKDAAWKRAEEVGKGTGYINCPSRYPLKSPND